MKPLFVRGKLESMSINKVLVDGGAAVNLMSHTTLKKLGKINMDTKPHNMVLSNYEGKVGTTLGVIKLDLTVGTITRPTRVKNLKREEKPSTYDTSEGKLRSKTQRKKKPKFPFRILTNGHDL